MSENFFDQMKQQFEKMIPAEQANKLMIPPPIFIELGGEILDFDIETQTMTNKYPVEDRFRNPLGFLQGGILVALMDNTIGPLSFVIAPPSVTTQFNTSYLRPVTPQDKFLTVTAKCTERTRRHIFLTATIYNEAGKTVAIGHATGQMIEPR